MAAIGGAARLGLGTVRGRAVAWQVLCLLCVLGGVWYLVDTTMANLASRNIATGFGFLDREAAFAIGESPIAYDASDSYGRAFLVGLLNTLRVAALGIVLATVVGTLVGLARLSGNWLLRRLAALYVETLRNVPLLLQLFFWYALITDVLPMPRAAMNPVAGVFLSNRGFMIPWPDFRPAHGWLFAAFALGLALSWAWMRWARRRRERTGLPTPVLPMLAPLLIGLPLAAYVAVGVDLVVEVPELKGFNFRGGLTLTPEFAALLLGLTLYTAAFIAEIVRSGIQAISRGQWEAARALGLRPARVLRFVILPQALRVIVPPLTSQYLNLTKNSSLAVAIGYPDLVSIANTTINQTGQAIEGIAMIMAVYLTISLGISLAMNLYNRSIALVER